MVCGIKGGNARTGVSISSKKNPVNSDFDADNKCEISIIFTAPENLLNYFFNFEKFSSQF